ncbi:(2Fe-2S)-binding protein [Streptomyces sp. NPDC049040]|uniref:(2Fe-2S)-binding protein n=1 Tax=Streptomyces sp. NPDC049040 TaxID=3365593 RepID=UPI003712C7A0
MTDQPQQPGAPGNSGAWQPVPGGGDYDPDQTMHVSFAAQLPPEPAPGEDPLIAHGPAGEADPATQWTIPVIREEVEGDSGEYSVGAFTSSWDRAPSPAAPTQSFPAGMFGQGAAAAASAAAQAPAEAAEPAAAAEADGRWTPFSGGEAVPWEPVDHVSAEAAWSAVVDEVPEAGAPAAADAEADAEPGLPPEDDREPEAEAEPDPEPEPEPEPVEQTRSEHPLASYLLRVNGTERPVTDAWLGESLLYVLRERLGLAGAKDGCEQGECGACSVQVDGRLVASCLVPAATAAGSEVRTVEGLSADGRLSDVQQALVECGAVQCGFCIPGMAMTVHDLLEGNHRPTDLEARQALSGNLCRCSGYRGVIEAVRQVVTARDADDPPAAARIPAQSGPTPPEAAV